MGKEKEFAAEEKKASASDEEKSKASREAAAAAAAGSKNAEASVPTGPHDTEAEAYVRNGLGSFLPKTEKKASTEPARAEGKTKGDIPPKDDEVKEEKKEE